VYEEKFPQNRRRCRPENPGLTQTGKNRGGKINKNPKSVFFPVFHWPTTGFLHPCTPRNKSVHISSQNRPVPEADADRLIARSRCAEIGLFKGAISRAIWLLITFPIYFWLYEVIVGYGQPRRKPDREKSE
jgi:hypothetical protein